MFRSDRFFDGHYWSSGFACSRSWSSNRMFSNDPHASDPNAAARDSRSHSEWLGFQLSFGWTQNFSSSVSWR